MDSMKSSRPSARRLVPLNSKKEQPVKEQPVRAKTKTKKDTDLNDLTRQIFSVEYTG
jgi:hypothetical protein